MFRKKKILLCSLCFSVCLIAGILTSCEDKPNQEELKASDISSVLAFSNNTDAKIKGVVFGVAQNGFFVADSTGSIFVNQTSSPLSIGDEVTIEGKYVIRNNQPIINFAQVNKNATGKTTITAENSTVTDISSLSFSLKTNYAKLYEVEGVLSKTTTGGYKFSDETSVINLTAKEDISSYDNAKITMQVITYSQSETEGWTVVCADKSTITEATLDVQTVKDEIFQEVTDSLTSKIYGEISLPTAYANEPSVKYNWSVVGESTAISILNNVAVVNEVSEDTSVTLKLTLTSGQTSAEKTYSFTVKAFRTVAISAIDTTDFEDGEKFYTSGKVVSKARNQGGDVFSLILESDGANFRVDFSSADEISSYKLGDTVKILEKHYNSYDENGNVKFEYFKGFSGEVVTPAEEGYQTDYKTLTATSLENETDYNAITSVGYTSVKLVKIVNPYLVYSGNTSFSFVRFGEDALKASSGYGSFAFSFLIDGLAYTGVKEQFDALGINKKNDGAKQYDGYTIYAYVAYSGSTVLQFIVPEKSAIVIDYSKKAEGEIIDAVTTTTFDASSQGDSFTLPASTTTAGALTWTSNSNAITIDGTTASYTKQTGNSATIVTLTATYTVNGQTYTTDIQITLRAEKITPLTVSQVLTEGKEDVLAMEGYFVGFIPGHSASATIGNGLYVSDGAKLIVVTNLAGQLVKDGNDFKIVDTILKVGDKITLYNLTLSGETISCKQETTATIDLSNNDLSQMNIQATRTISSTEDIQNYISTITKQTSAIGTYDILKVTATEESPIYFSLTNSYATFFGLSYNKTKFSFSSGYPNNTKSVFIGTPKAAKEQNIADFEFKNTDNELIGYKGSFYMVFEYSGSTSLPYIYVGILGAGFSLTPIAVAE